MPARAAITRSMRAGSATRRASGARPRRPSTGSSRPSRCSTPNAGVYGRWFAGGVCNTCWNAVDRHVMRAAASRRRSSTIPRSPVRSAPSAITGCRPRRRCSPAILRNFGVAKGDRVILYMPMVPEAVIAMLACARIGAVHSVVFGGFAAKELATRIDDAKPKVILSASCGIEPGRVVTYKPLLDEAIELAGHKPDACLILQRPQEEASLVRRPRPRLGEGCATRRSCSRARSTIACRSRPPIRSTSSTRRARPAGRRAWCATTAATWSRSNGR